MYDPEHESIKESMKSQELLLEQISHTNNAFINGQKTNTMIREREEAFHNLELGYKYFMDISNNLDQGIKVLKKSNLVF
jgi:hypothetical protein